MVGKTPGQQTENQQGAEQGQYARVRIAQSGGKIIARMRMLQAEGMSYRAIAVGLDDEGIRPKRGKRWIHTTVKSILARNAA